MADEHPAAPNEHAPETLRPEHPQVRWEPRDASFAGVLLIAISACVFGAVLLILLNLFFRTAEKWLARSDTSGFPLTLHPSQQLPAPPRLEPIDQLAHVEHTSVHYRLLVKERRLHSYGVTAEEGFVSIPIERAIALVAPELPVSDTPPADRRRQSGLIDAGESNSGRMFRGDHR